VIVNWNTREYLAQCLDSLLASHAADFGPRAHPDRDSSLALPVKGSLSVEVFVVDNASTDGSAEMVRADFPWVKLIENPENMGFARANNQAIELCQGRHVLLLNSDTVVHQVALHTLVTFLDANPRGGAAGARLLNGDGSLQESCQPMLTPGREFWRLSFLERLWPQATYPQERWDTATARRVEVIKGACLMLRKQALDQVGLLDDQYFMYTEEVDLCHRLAQAGWELWYVPAAKVTHFGEASSRQVAEAMYLQLYRSKIQFYRKFGGEDRASRFKTLVRAAYYPRWLVAAAGAHFSPHWAGRAQTYRRLLAEMEEM
jgi:GT2 family glycosyltransferase